MNIKLSYLCTIYVSQLICPILFLYQESVDRLRDYMEEQYERDLARALAVARAEAESVAERLQVRSS